MKDSDFPYFRLTVYRYLPVSGHWVECGEFTCLTAEQVFPLREYINDIGLRGFVKTYGNVHSSEGHKK